MSALPVNKWDRYILISRWLRARYSCNGRVVVDIGGVMTRFAALEYAFFKRLVLNGGAK